MFSFVHKNCYVFPAKHSVKMAFGIFLIHFFVKIKNLKMFHFSPFFAFLYFYCNSKTCLTLFLTGMHHYYDYREFVDQSEASISSGILIGRSVYHLSRIVKRLDTVFIREVNYISLFTGSFCLYGPDQNNNKH